MEAMSSIIIEETEYSSRNKNEKQKTKLKLVENRNQTSTSAISQRCAQMTFLLILFTIYAIYYYLSNRNWQH